MLNILSGQRLLLDRLLGASGRGALQKPRFQPRFQPRGKLLDASERGEVLRLSQCKFRRHLRGSAAMLSWQAPAQALMGAHPADDPEEREYTRVQRSRSSILDLI